MPSTSIQLVTEIYTACARLWRWRLQVCIYGIRLLAALCLMEAMTHCLYANAVAKHSLWRQQPLAAFFTPMQIGMTGFWVLLFMWLKVSCLLWYLSRWAKLSSGPEVLVVAAAC